MLAHYDAEYYTVQKIGSKPSHWAVTRTAFSTLQRTSGDNTNVAYLYWNDDHVIVNWNWLENDWNGTNPALLANLFISLPIIIRESFV